MTYLELFVFTRSEEHIGLIRGPHVLFIRVNYLVLVPLAVLVHALAVHSAFVELQQVLGLVLLSDAFVLSGAPAPRRIVVRHLRIAAKACAYCTHYVFVVVVASI